jgi:hypothetical protein
VIEKPTYNVPDFGDLITVEDWLECVEQGGFIDYDGNGDLLEKVGDDFYLIKADILPSMVTRGTLKDQLGEATHVMWFNK